MDMYQSLRTDEGEEIYRNSTRGNLWDEPFIFKTKGYRIIKNKFPYDKICDEHLLLITKHSVDYALKKAIEYAEKNKFRTILLNTSLAQSVPEIVHVHIIR